MSLPLMFLQPGDCFSCGQNNKTNVQLSKDVKGIVPLMGYNICWSYIQMFSTGIAGSVGVGKL